MELENNMEEKQQLDNYIEKKVQETLAESLENYLETLKKGDNKKEITIKDYISIDRIEGEFAVCELSDGSMMDIHKNEFPYSIEEGDIIKIEFKYETGEKKEYKILEKYEEEKLRRIQTLKEKMQKIKNHL